MKKCSIYGQKCGFFESYHREYTEGLTTMWSIYRQLKENRQILS